ncbi:MAG: hypothetical protein KatS3mg121_0363 [Gammaproteobacteria bacterium]|nr:MAG: hypothetical protein KatS3mg121_0363 [Gammaproteobacteria bacterium]
MNRKTAFLLCTSLFTLPAAAGGDPQAGALKAQQLGCVSCHGVDGHSTMPPAPGLVVPHIGGQYADYLAKALRDYRSGERQNPTMNGLAAGLSDQDIEDLAAHYAAQSGLEVVRPK